MEPSGIRHAHEDFHACHLGSSDIWRRSLVSEPRRSKAERPQSGDIFLRCKSSAFRLRTGQRRFLRWFERAIRKCLRKRRTIQRQLSSGSACLAFTWLGLCATDHRRRKCRTQNDVLRNGSLWWRLTGRLRRRLQIGDGA